MSTRRQRKPKNVPGAPTVFNGDQFCEALGITRAKLQQLVRDGRVRPLRIGTSTIRYLASEIERLAAEGGAQP